MGADYYLFCASMKTILAKQIRSVAKREIRANNLSYCLKQAVVLFNR